MESPKLTFRLDSGRFSLLQRIAEREGFTVSVIVRHLVYRFLEQEARLMDNRHE